MNYFASFAALPAELLRSIDGYLGRWGIALLLVFLLLALLGNLLLKRRMQHNRALLQSNKEMLATILDSVDAFIYIKSPTLEYQYVNRRISDLFGLPAEKIIGKRDEAFFDPGSAAEINQVDRNVLDSGKKVTVEESNVLKGESRVRTFLSIKMPLSMSPGAPPSLCGISTELTDYLEMQSRTHYLAFYDSLTGLPNRRLLMDSLTAAIEHDGWAETYSAVMVIDLDNFRLVNDIQGHESGDQLLISVAEQLRQRLDAEETLARFSSDEFVVLINNLGEQQTNAVLKAERVARQLLETIAQLRNNHSLPISASIGIALFTGGGEHSMDSVLQQADMALQQAKSIGGNTLCFLKTDMQTSV
ncbi:GGDEF domain-containing protein, partial [Halomonas sp. ISL-60]|nr:GGDEF domain-containing protein [Halomonas sp. ISL-60]